MRSRVKVDYLAELVHGWGGWVCKELPESAQLHDRYGLVGWWVSSWVDLGGWLICLDDVIGGLIDGWIPAPKCGLCACIPAWNRVGFHACLQARMHLMSTLMAVNRASTCKTRTCCRQHWHLGFLFYRASAVPAPPTFRCILCMAALPPICLLIAGH